MDGEAHRNFEQKKRPQRFFTPYTQRCVEMYLSGSLEEPFVISPVLGSNTAPLAARAKFVLRRLDENKIEVNPKVSVWRIGRSLGVRASLAPQSPPFNRGEDSRRLILKEHSRRSEPSFPRAASKADD